MAQIVACQHTFVRRGLVCKLAVLGMVSVFGTVSVLGMMFVFDTLSAFGKMSVLGEGCGAHGLGCGYVDRISRAI